MNGEELQIIQIVSQTGFAGVAFLLMYRLVTNSLDKLKDAVTENTIVTRELKTLLETIKTSLAK